MCGDGDIVGDETRMAISWAGLAEAISVGEVLYLADGAIRLRVEGAGRRRRARR